ncbi:MAG: winged helix-turn-helix domain-containing protein [Candidatus Nezhaarchaeota archaeon]|nr:winged helix-turn-helix domain-containing protein [Candidatus Nezhaarchaeota archaeon]MCX8142445.1 winged helix-turn-helix domain-containing protein [Candidatus Nezhaarchaeota archaeon]MDW8050582.1 winged helix-turn-helix domain-containing protein [Nitrososphaerota archaeon]
MNGSEESKGELKSLASDFSVLSNPVRLKLLMKVHERGSCTLKELIDEVQRDESTIKRHVKELIERGFLARSDDKRPKYYVTDKGILAITFLKVGAEPSIMRRPGEGVESKVELRTRGKGLLSNLAYSLRRMTIRKAVAYSLSIGCVIVGLLGFLTNVEVLFKILWLLMWLIIAYILKVLAS